MKVALYARVSTQRQAQTQNIEQQLERLQAHVQAQGWSVAYEDIFRDDGYSGATLKRPGLDRLRDRVAASQLRPCIAMEKIWSLRLEALLVKTFSNYLD